MGRWPDLVPLHSLDDYVVRIAEMGGALGDGVQHRLQIGGGGADDAEDFAGRGLLLEGLGEVAVEASVLNRNGCLVGECLEEGDLLGGERADLCSADDDGSKRFPRAQQWHRDDGSS